mmetsp:Transcript_5756/g.9165  ORF Transcript_5756/g.9165 Transcript_5756/m.9165 type:complete len:101 (+) Transcript_5756:770-1072(+)
MASSEEGEENPYGEMDLPKEPPKKRKDNTTDPFHVLDSNIGKIYDVAQKRKEHIEQNRNFLLKSTLDPIEYHDMSPRTAEKLVDIVVSPHRTHQGSSPAQ